MGKLQLRRYQEVAPAVTHDLPGRSTNSELLRIIAGTLSPLPKQVSPWFIITQKQLSFLCASLS
jgi:hypothetical protein